MVFLYHFVSNNSDWSALIVTNKAYCWYDDNLINKDTYGALYMGSCNEWSCNE